MSSCMSLHVVACPIRMSSCMSLHVPFACLRACPRRPTCLRACRCMSLHVPFACRRACGLLECAHAVSNHLRERVAEDAAANGAEDAAADGAEDAAEKAEEDAAEEAEEDGAEDGAEDAAEDAEPVPKNQQRTRRTLTRGRHHNDAPEDAALKSKHVRRRQTAAAASRRKRRRRRTRQQRTRICHSPPLTGREHHATCSAASPHAGDVAPLNHPPWPARTSPIRSSRRPLSACRAASSPGTPRRHSTAATEATAHPGARALVCVCVCVCACARGLRARTRAAGCSSAMAARATS